MTLDEIREALRGAELGRLADEAERLVLPAIRISAEMADEADIPVGASRIGGRPDLPAGVAWPERDGKLLGFLAQFNLAEVAAYDIERILPSTGMLCFFYDFTNRRCGVHPEDRGAWQVLYFDGDSAIFSRIEWPPALALLHRLPASLPNFSSTMTLTQEPTWTAHIPMSKDELLHLRDAVESLWQSDMKGATKEDEEDSDEDAEDEDTEDDYEYQATRHQLLGHPLLVHYGGMPWICELVSAGEPNPLFGDLSRAPYEEWDEQAKTRHTQAYERWRLLFQLGNVSGLPFPEGYEEEDDPNWRLSELCDLWARGGLMYFWIGRDRLAERDFSNVWMLGASQL